MSAGSDELDMAAIRAKLRGDAKEFRVTRRWLARVVRELTEGAKAKRRLAETIDHPGTPA